MKRKSGGPRASATITEGLPSQFFLVDGEREALGHVLVDDYRLDKILFEALSAHPAFTWNEDENSYMVNVPGPPQPRKSRYVNQAYKRPAVNDDKPTDDEPEDKPQPRSPAGGGAVNHADMTKNPKWRGDKAEESLGIKASYKSRFGWYLDLFASREEGRLPRGERGKRWRLGHDNSDKKVWFKTKSHATAAIEKGQAVKELL